MEKTSKLKNGELSEEDFVKDLADLFIHPNWSNLIKKAVEHIQKRASTQEQEQVQGDDADEADLDLVAEAIFLGPTSSRRARKLSTKYFGEEWVNNF